MRLDTFELPDIQSHIALRMLYSYVYTHVLTPVVTDVPMFADFIPLFLTSFSANITIRNALKLIVAHRLKQFPQKEPLAVLLAIDEYQVLHAARRPSFHLAVCSLRSQRACGFVQLVS